MEAQATPKILRALSELPDPRRHNVRHKLMDLLTLALFAVICGSDGWVQVVAYARAKEPWLRTFLELPGGIPSHDTFGRVFARLNPEAFEKCLLDWLKALVDLSGGQLVAIDGKSLRRSFENGWDKSEMVHMVSAFVAANSLVFAQVKTDGKGQELDGIEKLLGLLDLQGAVVTIDALGCQKEIAKLIVQAKADYLLQVKDNQPTLRDKIRTVFDEAALEGFAGYTHATAQTVDGGHGRIETRTVHVLWDIEHLGPIAQAWPGLRSLARVTRTRQVGEKTTTEEHYYIASLDRRKTAGQFLGYSREHWGVENKLHWILDVAFNEDQRRIRKGHGAENFSRVCRIGLNLLQAEKTNKVGIATKRHVCGWDNQYLLKVIAA
jgi:predicted transposase YbfD/YdcC